MADILYIQDTDGENSDEGVGCDMHQDGDSSACSGNQYDFLPPLLRLEKHACSENIFHRQLVGRLILETLPHVADSPTDVAAVMAVALKVADDPDAPVRAELMEQVPHITMLCHEDRDRLHHVIADHLLPLVVKFLSDTDNQVRKMAHAALLVMMEQRLVDVEAVERQVCPVVVMLTHVEGLTEYHSGIALMAKMAPLLGGERTEALFLPRFLELCTHAVFHVRKACATNIGDMCAVVGTETTERLLLGHFVALAADDVWGVRKSCAEVVLSVACKCTMGSRRDVLAPAFAALLADTSRWVRAAAYTNLGPLISTFAEPCITRLAYNRMRELVIVDQDGAEFRLCSPSCKGGDGEGGMVKYMDAGNQPYTFNFKYNLAEESHTIDLEPTNEGTTSSSNQSVISNECDRDGTVTSSRDDANANSSAETLDSNAVVRGNDRIGIGGPDGDTAKKETGAVNLPAYEDHEKNNRVYSPDKSRIEAETEGTHTAAPVISEDATSPSVANSSSAASSDSKAINEVESSTSKASGTSSTSDPNLRVTESRGLKHIHVESFNTFQYWRVPIPDISVDISLDGGKPTAVVVTAKVVDRSTQRVYSSKLDVNMDIDNDLDKLMKELEQSPAAAAANHVRASTGVTINGVYSLANLEVKSGVPDMKEEVHDYWAKIDAGTTADYIRDHLDGSQRRRLEQLQALPAQAIVPRALLEHYLTMTHPAQANATDNEIGHHCAFSFPAVVATLGPANWPLLKEAYETLAADMQWKVRRTVASSIHEVATILGQELATADLVPIFNGFIKDLDEVRIGALRHLAHFLKLLRPSQRNSYLPRLQEFTITDNEWNWRFREELAEQLCLSVELFTPHEARKYIMPLGVQLLLDKVSAVRHAALFLVNQLVRHVSGEASLVRGVLTELAQQFAHSKRWCRRQMFALLCARLVSERVLQEEEFARDVLPHLLDLSWDAVPNVRLAVARTIASPIMDNEYFLSEDSPHSDLMLQVMKRLQHDIDSDVRFFAASASHLNRLSSDHTPLLPARLA